MKQRTKAVGKSKVLSEHLKDNIVEDNGRYYVKNGSKKLPIQKRQLEQLGLLKN